MGGALRNTPDRPPNGHSCPADKATSRRKPGEQAGGWRGVRQITGKRVKVLVDSFPKAHRRLPDGALVSGLQTCDCERANELVGLYRCGLEC
jgi:hypothetical protein